MSFYTVAGPPPPAATNHPPVATAQFVTTLEDTARDLLLAGSDADGDALTFRLVDGPSNGALSGSAPTLTYTPNANFHGRDTLTFVANDGQQDSLPDLVTIEVTAVNDPPVLVNPLPEVRVDDATTAPSTTLDLEAVFGDMDSMTTMDALVFSISNNTNPELVSTMTTGNMLTLTPAARASRLNGTAVITVRATDQNGSFVETPVSVTVNRTYPFLLGESRLGDASQRLTRPAN